jgi:hypothetical protein
MGGVSSAHGRAKKGPHYEIRREESLETTGHGCKEYIKINFRQQKVIVLDGLYWLNIVAIGELL